MVTGAASGMGRATALLLAEHGAIVAVTDLDLDACAKVAAEAGPNAHPFALDVGDAVVIAAQVPKIAATLGGIDILINNAGVSAFAPLDGGDHYEEVWARALAILLSGQQRMVRAALPFLRESDAARIVNIASTEGLGATPGATRPMSPLNRAWWASRAGSRSISARRGSRSIAFAPARSAQE
jgi:3-oxoacyl-[acyl-carrier protein] reductase